MDDQPLLPDYEGGCITNVMAALVEPPDRAPTWMPAAALDADQVVLLVLDGLGWLQLQDRAPLAPVLHGLEGDAITTVAPSTTSTALTSITTGLPPGQHGVIGYRMNVDGDVLNVLRWQTNGRDARAHVPPEKVQSVEPFLAQRPVILTKAEFRQTGFTTAHLDGTRFTGYRMPSTLVAELERLTTSGEPFVYAYYDGIDKVAHEYGFGPVYDAELRAVDHMVGEMLAALPSGAALVITADHGQVEVGDRVLRLGSDVQAALSMQSGEGRFRWLHARPGRAAELLAATRACHGDTGWVASLEQVLDERWFGPVVTDAARSRLGDVALVARDDVAYADPDDTGPFELVGRHGSLTRAEMLVPLIAGRRP
ncbi:MAG: alkaline phosphatase family protein [Acidimicrobiales bacterium]